MNIVQYTKAASLEEAWELNQGRGAVVLGGCCWLRLSPQRRIAQAIDLSGLGLDAIENGMTLLKSAPWSRSGPLAAMKDC